MSNRPVLAFFENVHFVTFYNILDSVSILNTDIISMLNAYWPCEINVNTRV